MPEAAVAWELLLRGLAIGALTAAAIGIWRVAPGKPIGLAALMLCATAIAHVFENSEALRGQLGSLLAVTNFVSLGSAGFVWLFVVTLFEDRPLDMGTLAPAATLIVLGLLAYWFPGPIWLFHKVCQAGVALHALGIVVKTWRGDLVEARARIRVPFLAMVALYVLLLAGLHVAASYGLHLPLADFVNATALAALCLGGAAIFLRAPADVLGVIKPAEAGPAADGVDRAALENLNRAMDCDEIWRREGLTIGALAEAIAVPEHRLRSLINGQLGHRNFAAFVNARRIEAAKALLRDPTKARLTVAAIAYELGFGSLGPFNRAFKETTGVTPTEYRRTRQAPTT